MSSSVFRHAPVFSLMLLAQAAVASQLATTGQFSVGPNGTARFVIPIKVPPGVAGMEPNLSIVYDSGSGNGIFGVGTHLAGLSVITRCPRTLAQDGVIKNVGYVQDDAYCLDGARLIPVSGVNGGDGTEYRTELDGFSKIVSTGFHYRHSYYDPVLGQTVSGAKGGPVSFIVQTKSGQTMEYGTSGDSQIKLADDGMISAGTYGLIKGWALCKVTDRSGNYMKFTYTNISQANKDLPGSVPDDGNFYPVRIDYTGNATTQASNAVVFEKVSVLANTPIKYESGYVTPRTGFHYFNQLKTYIGVVPGEYQGSNYGTYIIEPNYDTSVQGSSWAYTRRAPRIVSVKECIGAYNCLKPITFGWGGSSAGYQYKTSAFPGQKNDYQNFFADLNGNGKKSWIRISQASDDAWIGNVNADGTLSVGSWAKVTQSVGSLDNYSHYFADVTGDGKADWVRVSRTTGEGWIAVGNGNSSFQFWSKYTQSVGATASNQHFFFDVNGDGRADWIQLTPVGGAMRTSVALSNGDGTFQFWNKVTDQAGVATVEHTFIDVNGDGKVDKLLVYAANGNVAIYLGGGDGSFLSSIGGLNFGAGTKYYFPDINGDGNVDVCGSNGGYTNWCALSKGDGTFLTRVSFGGSYGLNTSADVNGDGMADLITTDQSGNAPSITITSGDNGSYTDVFTQVVPTSPDLPAGVPYSSEGYQLFFADLSGHGRDDMIVVDRQNNKAFWGQSQFPNAGRVTSITNGLGVTTAISYEPLSDASVYTPDTDGTGTLRDALYPLLGVKRMPSVVSSVSTSNGIGGTVTTNYTYGGYKTDLARRRGLGFRWVQSVHQETGMTSRTEYRQDWPMLGLPSSSKRTLAGSGNNGVLSQTSYTYGCNDFVSASGCAVVAGRRYFPYVSQQVSSSWDLNGAVLPVVTTAYQFDAFGNPTQVVESSSDGFTKTVSTTYSNDTSKWWIGLPLRQTVKTDSP